MVEFLKKFADTERLNWGQWGVCIGIGIVSWPIGDLRNDVGLSPSRIVRHADLKIKSFAGNRGFEKQRRAKPKPDRETRGPRDHEIGGLELHFLASQCRIVRHADLKIKSFAGNRGFEKQRRAKPKPDRETRGPRDHEIGGLELHFLASELPLRRNPSKNRRMPLFAARTRYSLVKGERIVRSVLTAWLRAVKMK
ncbi:putative calcium-transporting atpase 13 [Quercus suber]|uniref:Calcium-transporting atpase 13 n=1 Tax=Quercus suber TaxID=58331 RepID=A0AAW0L4R7_QUESU